MPTHIVGLHATGLQVLHLSSFKTEERAQSQQQRHQWFNGWRNLTCLKQGPGVTPHCVQLMVGEGRLPVIGELISGGLISY